MLRAAEDDLVTGNPQAATTRLFRVVESPRWSSFAYAPEYENAEFTLGRALARSGAYDSAKRYLLRVLEPRRQAALLHRGVPGHAGRRARTREQAAMLARLEGFSSRHRLPHDSENERAYLRGKVAYEKGDLAARLGDVRRPPVALLRVGAVLPRPRSHARKRHSRAARATCARSSSRPTGPLHVLHRRPLLRHQGPGATWRSAASRTSRASTTTPYYFYFRVPEDSERLPDALFEASWSMFQKGEYEAAGAFIDQFDRMFPKSPLAPDVMLLHAMIDLKSCQFEKVRTTLDQLVKTYVPIEAEVAALIKDPGRRATL